MRRRLGRGARLVLLLLITAVVLLPVETVVGRAVTDENGRATWTGILAVLHDGDALTWFSNSLVLSLGTVAVTLALAAPAGYVLSRARGRWVSGYALALFVLQSLPVIVLVVPLFLVLAGLGLVDQLNGVGIVYVGLDLAVAIWMVAAATDAVPIEREESAWLDGCTVAQAWWRVVLPGAADGLVSAGILVFLQAWNEYLVAVVFLHSDDDKTLGIALAGVTGSPALALLMMVPPALLTIVLHRYVRPGAMVGAGF